jgi:hypothetical protein
MKRYYADDRKAHPEVPNGTKFLLAEADDFDESYGSEAGDIVTLKLNFKTLRHSIFTNDRTGRSYSIYWYQLRPLRNEER